MFEFCPQLPQIIFILVSSNNRAVQKHWGKSIASLQEGMHQLKACCPQSPYSRPPMVVSSQLPMVPVTPPPPMPTLPLPWLPLPLPWLPLLFPWAPLFFPWGCSAIALMPTGVYHVCGMCVHATNLAYDSMLSFPYSYAIHHCEVNFTNFFITISYTD